MQFTKLSGSRVIFLCFTEKIEELILSCNEIIIFPHYTPFCLVNWCLFVHMQAKSNSIIFTKIKIKSMFSKIYFV